MQLRFFFSLLSFPDNNQRGNYAYACTNSQGNSVKINLTKEMGTIFFGLLYKADFPFLIANWTM